MNKIVVQDSRTFSTSLDEAYEILTDYRGFQEDIVAQMQESGQAQLIKMDIINGGKGDNTEFYLDINLPFIKAKYQFMVSESARKTIIEETDIRGKLKNTIKIDEVRDGVTVTIQTELKHTTEGFFRRLIERAFIPKILLTIIKGRLKHASQQIR